MKTLRSHSVLLVDEVGFGDNYQIVTKAGANGTFTKPHTERRHMKGIALVGSSNDYPARLTTVTSTYEIIANA